MSDSMTEAQTIADRAREGVEPQTLEDDVVFLPTAGGGQGRIVDMERYSSEPRRQTGTTTVFDAASFNMTVADKRGDGRVDIFIDRDPVAPKIVGVLNASGWGDHRVSMSFRPTPAWTRWSGISGSLVPQSGFAEFIEENLEDIHQPTGAHMLEIASHLEATRTGHARSAIRLSDGSYDIAFAETVETKMGATKVNVPETLVLQLAPFQGVPLYAVRARFRYRLGEGRVTMGIKLIDTDRLIATVLDDVVAKIERGTNVSVLEGVAPEAQKAGADIMIGK